MQKVNPLKSFLGLQFPLNEDKLTALLKLECKIIDGTANNHLDELETCDDHSHDLGNSHSGGEWIVILAHVLSAHRMALRAK